MASYRAKIELLTPVGDHLRRIPRVLAQAMVDAGHAEVVRSNGCVRQVKLTRPAEGYTQRLGPAANGWWPVKFYRLVNLDCGARIVEHHPRSTYPEPE